MSVAKAFVRSLFIAGMAATPALGGSMLSLGMTSSDSFSAPSSYSAPVASSGSSWSAQLFRLGYSGDQATPSATPNIPPAKPAPIITTQAPAPAPAVAAPTAPAPAPAPIIPAPQSFAAPQANASSRTYDAVINLGSGSFADAASLTNGNPQPWYASNPVAQLYGGTPNLAQRGQFEDAVLRRVEQTFRLSGIPISLTTDPNAIAAHSLSVASQTTNPTLPGAIGMTYLGGNGFHYIDQSAPSARSVDQLEWIVAHNVSHELMLAFGVPEDNDTTGNFVDARNARWDMMVNPNARFSTDATRDLLSKNFQDTGSQSLLQGAQLLETQPVPEPATIALWAAGATALALVRRARSRQA